MSLIVSDLASVHTELSKSSGTVPPTGPAKVTSTCLSQVGLAWALLHLLQHHHTSLHHDPETSLHPQGSKPNTVSPSSNQPNTILTNFNLHTNVTNVTISRQCTCSSIPLIDVILKIIPVMCKKAIAVSSHKNEIWNSEYAKFWIDTSILGQYTYIKSWLVSVNINA